VKAIVYTKYGSPDVLQLKEVEKPAPGDDEVLVRVNAVSVNAADCHLMRGKPFLARFMIGGFRRPKNSILGSDIAGRVEAVGKDVTQFQPGDEVFGGEVTGVCSPRNLDMARSIGADHVIDYTQEDFTRNGRQYDLIVDIAASRSVSDYKRALSPQGVCVIAGFSSMFHLLRSALLESLASKSGSKKFVRFLARLSRKDLVLLKELLEADKVVPVIDRCYPLSKVAEAMRYFGVEHARGRVIITVENKDK
jgi:NADPH:quinone reductase-like Zn-dependent oxidoreductase